MTLYRYIPFESFVDLVQSKSLPFVYPPLFWEDTYEGLLFRAAKTDEGRKKISEILRKYSNQSGLSCLLENEDALKLTRFQCWSQAYNSVAMWSIYSYGNKAVMISTTSDKLKGLNYLGSSVELMPVKYVDQLSLNDEVKSAFGTNKFYTSRVFKTKRKSFEHESEIRVYVGKANSPANIPIKVPIPEISNFIDSVWVHPSAPDWYVKVVATYCSLNNIHFGERSSLYKFTLPD